MSEPSEMPKISEVKDSEDERLMKLTDIYEDDGWTKTVKDVTNEILNSPGWLESEKYLPSYTIYFTRKLLERIRSDGLERLDDLMKHVIDSPACNAFVLRFMEVFSEKYNFPYVWRGGSLKDLDGRVIGTFTFFVGVAKDKVMNSYDGPRKNPCLIALPVKALIEGYKTQKSRCNFIFEHGCDGIFNASFNLLLPEVPDGTMVYLPD
jgi:hypothetical protein